MVDLGMKMKEMKKKEEGGSWVIVAAGALFSTLSIRLGFKLKQALHTNLNRSNPNHNATNLHRGTGNSAELKCPSNGQLVSESDGGLPLVTQFNKENSLIWASSPDRLELPSKPYQSDSPSVSESGSDIFSKREVIHKLRQQLKRRDDMVLQMQDQIAELRNSLNAQHGLSSHLQLQLDAANRDLFDSEREIQRLRKVIADHCVGQFQHDKSSSVPARPDETRNGHAHGEISLEPPEKIRDDDERIEMLRKQVGELKEVIEGKEYLLQNYKEQKVELTLKMMEMQKRLDSQLPNIL